MTPSDRRNCTRPGPRWQLPEFSHTQFLLPSGPPHLFLETNAGSVSSCFSQKAQLLDVLADGLSGTTSVLLVWAGQIWKRKEERTHVVKSQARSLLKISNQEAPH